MLELPHSYTRRASLIGFEPNPGEYKKLMERDTDPIRAGYRPPQFAEEHYFNTALWDRKGDQTLVVTNGPGTPTLMGLARRELTSNMYLEGHPTAFYDVALRPLHEEIITTQRLDSLIDRDSTIDFLKIDVEGAELRVLRGASGLLEHRRILAIRSEFVTFPYYEDHPTLADQHLFLSQWGFRLIDFDPFPGRYTRGATKIPATEDRRLLYGGDAVYILDPDRFELDPIDLQRLAAITFALGFSSLGISLLRDAEVLPEQEIEEIEDALAEIPFKRRLLTAWEQAPHKVQQAATLGRRFMSRAKRGSSTS